MNHTSVFHHTKSGQKHGDFVSDVDGFNRLAITAKQLTGINLPNNDKNRTLMAGRLLSMIQKNGFKDYNDFAVELEKIKNITLREEFISCLTTNTTHFFRESAHYDVLTTYFKERAKDPDRSGESLRIWCSAASSGQEPYSILFTLLQTGFQVFRQKLEFLATDIDLSILEKAAQGRYTPEEIKSLPASMKNEYFQARIEGGKSFHAVSPELRKLVHFARFNLIQDKPAFKDKFDVIFCRNVLIYFEKDVSSAVIDMLISQLKPGGLIFLGHVETGLLKNKSVTAISHAVYRKNSK